MKERKKAYWKSGHLIEHLEWQVPDNPSPFPDF
jgi:hypothetical protein